MSMRKESTLIQRERLLEPKYEFKEPALERVVDSFLMAHKVSERQYRGDGRWEGFSLRYTSRRVIGYIEAYKVLGDEIYRKRAEEGLGYLLRMQDKDGGFKWYFSHAPQGFKDRDHCLYVTGIAGVAFVRGYELFGKEEYLAASKRAVEWEKTSPISGNYNYNAFAIWHLAEHYRITGEREALESAIYKARYGVLPYLGEDGVWHDELEHNALIWYHGIMLRGLATLYGVLPGENPFKEELYGAIVRAVNRVVRTQQEDGSVLALPWEDKRDEGLHFIMHGLLAVKKYLNLPVDELIWGMETFKLNNAKEITDWDRISYVDEKWDLVDTDKAKLAYSFGFEEFVEDEWGVHPKEVFPAWLEWYQITSEQGHFFKEGVLKREGCYGQGFVVEGCGKSVNAGFGVKIPRGVLKEEHLYDAEVLVAGIEEGGGKIGCFIVAGYGGGEKEDINCMGGEYVIATPTVGYFTPVRVRFEGGKENIVYVIVSGHNLREGEKIGVVVDQLRIWDLGEKPLDKYKTHYGYAKEIMVLGEYLSIYGKGEEK